jgi:hypothetical protein
MLKKSSKNKPLNQNALQKKFYPTYIPRYKESAQKVPEIYTNSYLDDKISVVSHIFLN